jgi:hypothetical protein
MQEEVSVALIDEKIEPLKAHKNDCQNGQHVRRWQSPAQVEHADQNDDVHPSDRAAISLGVAKQRLVHFVISRSVSEHVVVHKPVPLSSADCTIAVA